MHEWAYQSVKRKVLVEELIKSSGDTPPKEYKFHTFGGKCGLIQVHNSENWFDGVALIGGPVPTLTFYTPTWSRIEMEWQLPAGPAQAAPSKLDEMLQLAELLGQQFDYIRVDLYLVGDHIKFGELTPYHMAGAGVIRPAELDFELGAKWQCGVGRSVLDPDQCSAT